MTEESARFLISAEGAALLAQGSAVLQKRRDLTPERRAAALAVYEGRERAVKKGIPHAAQLFVTPDLLAQASSPQIATWHAQQLAPYGTVLDCCCGAGLDAIAFAAAGLTVLAYELDPARTVFAQANADLAGYGSRIHVTCGDVTEWKGTAPAAFFDPARREGASRVSRHGELYAPPLSFLETLRQQVPFLLTKLSPALPDEVLSELGGQVLFLSEDRTCKEACVRLGGACGPAEAVLLPSGTRFSSSEVAEVAGSVGEFLLDPDPAVVRAGVLGALGALRISESDSYLTHNTPLFSPAVRCYRVQAVLPYRDRILGRWLREQGIGRLVVKKRRFPKEPAEVHRELGLKGGGREATLVLVAQGKSWLGVVCDPVMPP